MSRFSRRISRDPNSNNTDILAITDYHIANNTKSRDDIYRLRYRSYRREGIISENSRQFFFDKYDFDPNAVVFGTHINDYLAGSIRIHLLSKENPTSPAYDTYHDILSPLLRNAETMIDPSRFVIDPEARTTPLLPFSVIRLACMMAEHFESDWMLATVRPEHAAFYKRFCSLEPMSELRPYPGLSCPLMLLGARNKDVQDHVFARYPIFSSTFAERLALFGTERAIERFGMGPANDSDDNSPQLLREHSSGQL
ncbi:MAG TPA: hypothetical protein ENH55_03895 [Aurantimonas coralicida]|uniref:N-acyl amino acid synthase FeeM catalytic core domain-containing protein n=2 Tax=root TaxID=1 RepID=A0A9C9NEV5_9HYPH|nr:hypothetical protein [Aurantimonas coralicida]HEU00074.1 hypothetical protein [Aurantimonas coralicida]